MKSILFIGAFPPEIELIARGDSPENLMVEALDCGVGNVSAALALQERLLDRDKPPVAEAIFIGSAGCYDEGPFGPPLNLGFAVGFENREIAVTAGDAHLPDLMLSALETRPGPLGLRLRDELGARTGSVNSPDSLTLSPPPGIRGEFENMEAFGLACAAARSELPFCAVLALTNRVGPDGSAQWRANHREMGRALQEAILRVLRNT